MMSIMNAYGFGFLEGNREGVFLYDENGKRYIDCISSASIYNIGRRNQDVIEGLRRGMERTDQGNFPMISEEKSRLAKRLSLFVSEAFECAVFSVMRGESIDFACKLARGYTGRKELISFEGAWLGQTGFALSLSDRKDKHCFEPLIPGVKLIQYGSIEAAEKAISGSTAAVIIEPVQVENGCRAATAEYLRVVRNICTKNKTVLIFDETQSGMGRSGNKFAFQLTGINPDILVMGEALGGGIFPIAATLFTQKLNSFLNKHPMIHLSTFGGSDIGCEVACSVLDVYEKTRPWENAQAIGNLLTGLLQDVFSDANVDCRVEGIGLMTAIHFKDRETAFMMHQAIVDRGVLCLPGMVADNTIVLRPPLIITEADIREIVNVIEEAVQHHLAK